MKDEELILPTPIKTGYKFLVWYKDSALTEQITGPAIQITQNTAVYASFAPNTYTVTFESNNGTLPKITNEDGTISYKTTVVTQGTKLSTALTTRPGYEFDGWYIDAALTQKYNFDNVFTLARDTTLYAKWSIGDVNSGTGGSASGGGSVSVATKPQISDDTGKEAEKTEEVTEEAKEAVGPKALKLGIVKLPKVLEENGIEFKDLEASHWAKGSIDKLVKAGYIKRRQRR